MHKLPWVYIAGPYSSGDKPANVAAAVAAAEQVLRWRGVPYVPHLTHFWDAIETHPYDFWLWYDRQFLESCDLLYRLPGYSSGADSEIRWAEAAGIPCIYSSDALQAYLWAALDQPPIK